MISSTCMACGRASARLRSLPRPDETTALRFSSAPVCETCVAPTVEQLREIVRRAECADSEDADEVDRLRKLIAFLQADGFHFAEAGGGRLDRHAGMRRGLHTILDSLERQLVCSQCWSRGPESRIHLVPYFNNSVGRYVTSFRCDGCIESALAETIARVKDVDGASEIDTLGDLLRSHGVAVHEWLRGEPLDRLRPVMIRVLASLRRADIRLHLRLGNSMPVPLPPRA